MDSNRRVCIRICVIVLLLAHIATAAVLSGNNQTTDFSLDCTNDFDELMLCQLELQNCTEYSLTLQSVDGKKNCILQQCGTGQCCCSFRLILVIGETHTASIWKDGNVMESKVFGVKESIKPKTPTIKSVTESEGNFEVKWTSNMMGFIKDYMTAEVTYYKKGETKKTSGRSPPYTVDGLNYYAIDGQDLDPSSTYVVSVKSFMSLSGKFSDSSKEWEFQTGNNQTTDFSLDCTNDFDELMLCQLELQNCTEYSLTLQSVDGKKNCILQQCGTGQCCCSFRLILVIGETHTASIWKDGNVMESKVFGVKESIKPKTPTIKSVTESEGNFEVKWTSNMMGFINNYMTAEVTYYKKGETKKTSERFKPVTTADGLNYYEGQDLDPSSTYVVSVKSFFSLNGKFSDSSKEWEFQIGLMAPAGERLISAI